MSDLAIPGNESHDDFLLVFYAWEKLMSSLSRLTTTTHLNATTVAFYGGSKMLLVPVLGFMLATSALFALAQAFDMMALATIGFLTLLLGALLSKSPATYWKAALKGMSAEMASTVVLLLLVAGIFAGMMKAGGLATAMTQAVSAFGLSGGFFVVAVLFACALLALATGSSIGTILAAMPVVFPAGVALGVEPALIAAAVLSGAIFGDNVAPVSDVTLISALTQHNRKGEPANVAEVVRTRLPYALGALALAAMGYLVASAVMGSGAVNATIATTAEPTRSIASLTFTDLRGLVMLIPLAVLVVVALKTHHILQAMTAGLLVGVPLGVLTGAFPLTAVIDVQNGAPTGFLVGGIANMAGISLLCLMLFGFTGVVTESGIEAELRDGLQRYAGKQITGAHFERALMMLTLITTVLFAGVTSAACALVGTLTDRLGQEAGVSATRRSHLLSGFANSLPVLCPFSAFILITTAAVKGVAPEVVISPLTLATLGFYPLALFVVFGVSVLRGARTEAGEPIELADKTHAQTSTKREAQMQPQTSL